ATKGSATMTPSTTADPNSPRSRMVGSVCASSSDIVASPFIGPDRSKRSRSTRADLALVDHYYIDESPHQEQGNGDRGIRVRHRGSPTRAKPSWPRRNKRTDHGWLAATGALGSLRTRRTLPRLR